MSHTGLDLFKVFFTLYHGKWQLNHHPIWRYPYFWKHPPKNHLQLKSGKSNLDQYLHDLEFQLPTNHNLEISFGDRQKYP